MQPHQKDVLCILCGAGRSESFEGKVVTRGKCIWHAHCHHVNPSYSSSPNPPPPHTIAAPAGTGGLWPFWDSASAFCLTDSLILHKAMLCAAESYASLYPNAGVYIQWNVFPGKCVQNCSLGMFVFQYSGDYTVDLCLSSKVISYRSSMEVTKVHITKGIRLNVSAGLSFDTPMYKNQSSQIRAIFSEIKIRGPNVVTHSVFPDSDAQDLTTFFLDCEPFLDREPFKFIIIFCL